MHIRRAYDKHIDTLLPLVVQRYGIEQMRLRRLSSHQRCIYDYRRGDTNIILKITHSGHRTPAQVQAEVNWVSYLAAQGVPVARPLPSGNNRLAEVFNVGDAAFTAVAFEKLAGRLTDRADWSAELFRRLGQLVGRMHALARSYRLPRKAPRRPQWHEVGILSAARQLLAGQPGVLQQLERIQQQVRRLPHGRDAFGLVHHAVGPWNFFLHQGALAVFDFDDCAYSWFADDIAGALFHVLTELEREREQVPFTREFLTQFMAGYQQEHRLPPAWLERLPYFLQLRELQHYLALQAEEAPAHSSWAAEFLRGRRARIEQAAPVVDFDFAGFARQLAR